MLVISHKPYGVHVVNLQAVPTEEFRRERERERVMPEREREGDRDRQRDRDSQFKTVAFWGIIQNLH